MSTRRVTRYNSGMQSFKSHNPTEPPALDLAEFNAQLDDCVSCATVTRGYRHVPGGGCQERPELMLVFINPTVRNMSAHADWPGVRFPFASKPKLWDILAEAGWVRPDLPARIADLGRVPSMVAELVEEARRQRIYLTNAVKCVDDGSTLPLAERVAAAWPQLQAEIALVQPRHIVALGLIPFRVLTGQNVRLADELWAAQEDRLTPYASLPIAGITYPVFPCYFPTGRGNPVAATTMLRSIRRQLQTNAVR